MDSLQPRYDKESTRGKVLNSTTFAWSLWDWGSAAFNAVATTFVFSVYLTKDGVFMAKEDATLRLSIGLTIAGIIIALTAPISGQRADRKGKGTFWLGVNSFFVFLCLLGMVFVAPEGPLGAEGMLWLGVACLGIGNIFFEFASVNYNAMLSRVSERKYMGRVSGLGWGMGYIGGIVLLIILLYGFISDNALIETSGENGWTIRVCMLVAAFWFGAFALPVLFKVRGRRVAGVEDDIAPEGIVDSYKHLWGTVKMLHKIAPDTLKFMIASAIFRDGLAGVFTYGAILAATVFAFTDSEVVLFGVVANVVAGIATIAFGALDDKIGPRKVILGSLLSMILCAMAVYFFHDGGKIVFWTVGMALCVFVGPTQSASRSYLGRLIPKGREGEVFGLYATTGRAVSFLAPAMFALSVALGKMFVPDGVSAQHWGIVGISIILLAGLLLMLPVKDPQLHSD
ncbi:MAG: MFS transporter [Actinomycetaceae bacterium]|nr:MFS transporter [Actinomycetaceae bacterium]